MEVSRRQGDFALVGVAAQVSLTEGLPGSVISDVRIAVTGAADTPHRATEAEELLAAQEFDAARCTEAAEALRSTLHPVDDLHAIAEYRRDVAGELMIRAVIEAHGRAVHTAAA
ncbi:hypothetical protein [Pseudonocardia sp. H11422]|uniref:hypothetical protein n=1 Tax=Pseudonocardia sp. H11422 TaxID=2835866 RepID=UPI002027EBAE|nr:hypothetical protein [Pseudonocardia sp. H11422]